jgi:hypothetical protein
VVRLLDDEKHCRATCLVNLSRRLGREPLNPLALADVRFVTHCGFKLDIAMSPERVNFGSDRFTGSGARSAYADTVAGTLPRVVLVLRRIALVAQTPAPLVDRRGMINSYGRAHLAAD